MRRFDLRLLVARGDSVLRFGRVAESAVGAGEHQFPPPVGDALQHVWPVPGCVAILAKRVKAPDGKKIAGAEYAQAAGLVVGDAFDAPLPKPAS